MKGQGRKQGECGKKTKSLNITTPLLDDVSKSSVPLSMADGPPTNDDERAGSLCVSVSV